MHLFVDISNHGLGHLALTAPVLRALSERVPDLRLTIQSALPQARLADRVKVPFDWIDAASDFGFVMHDALRVDLAASAAAYRAAHVDWPARVATAAQSLARVRPDAVLTSVSYRSLAAAAQLGIPAFALCPLNWADLFAHYFGGEPWATPIHAEMRTAYRGATAFLRCAPAMPMPDLSNTVAVGPIAALGRRQRLLPAGERAVLVAMGGIAHAVPVDDWPRLPGVRWLVTRDWGCRHPDALAWESLGLGFSDLLASVDAVVGKPGYGLFTEAACNGVPVLYQRRPDWPEQDCLIDWLGVHGRCLEVPAATLQTGDLDAALAAVWSQPEPPRPTPTGAAEVAEILLARVAAG